MTYRATTPNLSESSESAMSDLLPEVELEESETPYGFGSYPGSESASNPATLEVNGITLSDIVEGNLGEELANVATEGHICNCDRCPTRLPALPEILPWQKPENLKTSRSRSRMKNWEKRYLEMIELNLDTRNQKTYELLSIASMAAKIKFTRNPESNQFYMKSRYWFLIKNLKAIIVHRSNRVDKRLENITL